MTKINSLIFDHTNSGSTQYSVRLNGTVNEKIGLAKSLQVMPGDVIRMEVYAKYLDPNSSNWTTALANLISSISSGTAAPGTVIDGASTGATAGFPFAGLFDNSGDNSLGPKAYLNWLVFDKNFVFVDGGYQPVTDLAIENGTDVPHEQLTAEITVAQQGYVYVYLSNDNATPIEVYFDDFTIEHVQTPVVQVDDYYPFGLTFNSFRRETTKENRFLYNDGAERQFDLDLNVDLTKFRTYDPVLGRWWQIDPQADKEELIQYTPYNYSFNNPIRWNDPLGDCPPCGHDIINLIAKYVGIASQARAPAQRLLSGTSGSVPSSTNMGSNTRTIVKTTSTANDINQIAETGKQLAKEATLDVADAADKGGEALSDAGTIAAPFTAGTSLTLVPVGETVSAAGKSAKALVHLADGENEKAASEGANIVVGAVTNSLTSAAIKQSKKVGNIKTTQEETSQETVLGGISSLVNKVVSFFSGDDEED